MLYFPLLVPKLQILSNGVFALPRGVQNLDLSSRGSPHVQGLFPALRAVPSAVLLVHQLQGCYMNPSTCNLDLLLALSSQAKLSPMTLF